MIDWSAFDTFPESVVTCVNDHTYRSHAKMVAGTEHMDLIARRPCPTCGIVNIRRASSPPESFTIKR